jgi:hypothetical protein
LLAPAATGVGFGILSEDAPQPNFPASLGLHLIRTFASPNGGSPPGGTPPGPTSIQGSVTNEEIMKELLKLSKQISNIKKKLGV